MAEHTLACSAPDSSQPHQVTRIRTDGNNVTSEPGHEGGPVVDDNGAAQSAEPQPGSFQDYDEELDYIDEDDEPVGGHAGHDISQGAMGHDVVAPPPLAYIQQAAGVTSSSWISQSAAATPGANNSGPAALRMQHAAMPPNECMQGNHELAPHGKGKASARGGRDDGPEQWDPRRPDAQKTVCLSEWLSRETKDAPSQSGRSATPSGPAPESSPKHATCKQLYGPPPEEPAHPDTIAVKEPHAKAKERRRPNFFNMYVSDEVKCLKAANPGLDQSVAFGLASSNWKDLSGAEKAAFKAAGDSRFENFGASAHEQPSSIRRVEKQTAALHTRVLLEPTAAQTSLRTKTAMAPAHTGSFTSQSHVAQDGIPDVAMQQDHVQPSLHQGNKLLESRSSKFKGVTKHRRSGRWEAHIWVKEMGRQVYLGGFEHEAHAAEVYDVAALRAKGSHAKLNFPRDRYADLMEYVSSLSLDELAITLRRQSQGFSRGSSKYRGVTHHPTGRWESRIGIPGSRHLYLGLFESEREAAVMYDRALVRLRGAGAATNFGVSDYKADLAAHYQMKQAELGFSVVPVAEDEDPPISDVDSDATHSLNEDDDEMDIDNGILDAACKGANVKGSSTISIASLHPPMHSAPAVPQRRNGLSSLDGDAAYVSIMDMLKEKRGNVPRRGGPARSSAGGSQATTAQNVIAGYVRDVSAEACRRLKGIDLRTPDHAAAASSIQRYGSQSMAASYSAALQPNPGQNNPQPGTGAKAMYGYHQGSYALHPGSVPLVGSQGGGHGTGSMRSSSAVEVSGPQDLLHKALARKAVQQAQQRAISDGAPPAQPRQPVQSAAAFQGLAPVRMECQDTGGSSGIVRHTPRIKAFSQQGIA
ncbi:hypothetical protein WJX84_008553 [Apatococcus fuscideae]|uniref:AP2/ERF domain-containing protein n=1 Tax=Apatococcus fuscideae TaxID=2026836 RepID=A0AAW1TH18_9CHLO